MEDILRDHLGKWYKTYVDWYSEWMSRWLKICLQQYSSLLFVRTFDENQCHDYERFFLLIVFITSQNKIYLHLMIFSVPYMMPTPALRLAYGTIIEISKWKTKNATQNPIEKSQKQPKMTPSEFQSLYSKMYRLIISFRPPDP